MVALLRRRLLKTLAVLVAFAALCALVLASVESGEEYCRLCGKWRAVTTINPLGFFRRGLVVREYLLCDKLGEVLRRYMPGGRCEHVWVVVYHTNWFREWVWSLRGPVFGSPRYRSLVVSMNMHEWDSFEWLASHDPEVALTFAKMALDPNRDEEKFRSIWAMIPWASPCPEDRLVEVRAILGLEPLAAQNRNPEQPPARGR